MGFTEAAFIIVAIVIGGAVLVGAWTAMGPLREEPHEPGVWISVLFAGLASAAVCVAGIVVAEAGNGFSGTGDYALLAGSGVIGTVAVALVGSAIAIYEPDRAPTQES